jgi:hypothetical protein
MIQDTQHLTTCLGRSRRCDGSVFPTGAAVNPSLTIEALATRTARLALAAPTR